MELGRVGQPIIVVPGLDVEIEPHEEETDPQDQEDQDRPYGIRLARHFESLRACSAAGTAFSRKTTDSPGFSCSG